MVKKWISIIWLITIQLVVVNCSPAEEENDTFSSVLGVKGDPMQFVAGATFDSSSGIPESFFIDPAINFQVSTVGFITEAQVRINPDSSQEPPAPADPASLQPVFTIQSNGADQVLLLSDDAEQPSYEFERRNNSFFFTKANNLSFDGTTMIEETELLHYSVKADQSAFSILFSIREGENTGVIAVTFAVGRATSLFGQTLSAVYEYLVGAGFPLAWNTPETLDVRVCESGNADIDSFTETSLLEWQSVVSTNLTITAQLEPDCPPFSDLNTIIVKHIPRWVEIRGSSGVLGVTAFSFDTSHAQLKDADIFLFDKEFEQAVRVDIPSFQFSRMLSDSYQGVAVQYRRTVIHEMAHVLGLGHKFDGTESVTSYDPRHINISNYDREALGTLYPVSSP